MSSRVQTISCERVADLVRKGAIPWPVTILDVRDVDFHGGCIRGAWHAPYDEAIGNLGALAVKLMRFALKMHSTSAGDRHLVICHCMLSKCRGPEIAIGLASTLPRMHVQWKREGSDLAQLDLPNIAVMEGGYEHFARLFGEKEPGLFADRPIQVVCE
jgi:hypothetical protein